VSKSEYRDATIDDADVIDGSDVSGVVEAGDRDAYWFDGSIVDFTLAGSAAVEVEYDVR